MTIYRPSFRVVVLSLLVAAAGGVIGITPAAAGTSSVSVTVLGLVRGPSEWVTFSGKGQITSTLLIDDFGGPPSVQLTLDLTGVPGVGATTKTRYVISGPQLMIRSLASLDVIDFTFPFVPSGAISPIGIGNAWFGIDFDVSSGSVKAAGAVLSNP